MKIEFAEAVTKMYDNFDHIEFKKVEKVMAVSVMHKGLYIGLSAAYAYTF